MCRVKIPVDDVLLLLSSDYSHPGRYIQNRINDDPALYSRICAKINEIYKHEVCLDYFRSVLNGEKPITAKIAIAVCGCISGLSPLHIMNMQVFYDMQTEVKKLYDSKM